MILQSPKYQLFTRHQLQRFHFWQFIHSQNIFINFKSDLSSSQSTACAGIPAVKHTQVSSTPSSKVCKEVTIWSTKCVFKSHNLSRNITTRPRLNVSSWSYKFFCSGVSKMVLWVCSDYEKCCRRKCLRGQCLIQTRLGYRWLWNGDAWERRSRSITSFSFLFRRWGLVYYTYISCRESSHLNRFGTVSECFLEWSCCGIFWVELR